MGTIHSKNWAASLAQYKDYYLNIQKLFAWNLSVYCTYTQIYRKFIDFKENVQKS